MDVKDLTDKVQKVRMMQVSVLHCIASLRFARRKDLLQNPADMEKNQPLA